MRICRHALLLPFLLVLMLTGVACIESGDQTPAPTANGIASNGVSPGIHETATGSSTNHEPPAYTAPASSSQAQASILDLSNGIADIVEDVQPAVVFISAQVETRSFFFNQRTVQTSSGSGVIVDSSGYILTNNHVVEGAIELEVTVPGVSEPFAAEVVGLDPLTDLAVIKIDGEGFPVVPFGEPSTLRPGNLVIAVGYPLALEHGATITLGVVSNTERSFTLDDATFYDVIQTDAAINPGNSGGPLIDMTGRLVGINSVMAGTAENIGFAISVNTARSVYESLISGDHHVARPWLGVVLVTLTPDIAADADLTRQTGVVIRTVEDGSPADKAGLEVRDVITVFDGHEVTGATQLIKELWLHKVGDEVSITFWRGKEEKDVVVKLTMERPE